MYAKDFAVFCENMATITLLSHAVFIVASFLSILSGYQYFKYRTPMARWGGTLQLFLAVDLISYSIQLVTATVSLNHFGYSLQMISFYFVTILWLVFILEISDLPKRLNLHLIFFIFCLPAIFLTILLSTAQGDFSSNQSFAIIGSLRLLPIVIGSYGSFLLTFLFSIGLISILFLLRLFLLPNQYNQKLALPMLLGTIFLISLSSLEYAGFNPTQPISFTQMGLAVISFFYFYITVIWQFGGILPISRESVFDGMNDAVLILDYYNTVIDANQPAQKIIGLNKKSIVNQKLSSIWPFGARLLQENTDTAQIEREVAMVVEGQEFIFDVLITKFLGLNNVPTGYLILLRNITGREKMEQALNERSIDLQRTNAFMAALAELNVALQSASDSSEINATLGDELNKMGLKCFVAQLDPLSNELFIRYISIQSEVLRRIEKIFKNRIVGFRLSRDQFPNLYAILDAKKITFRPFHPDDLADSPGKISTLLIEQAIRLLGFAKDTPALVLPLKIGEQNLGMLGVWGPTLREADIPPFQIFANQVAHMMERTQLYENEIQRSAELARVNSLVIALSKVTSGLGSTSNSEWVLDTLGSELKNAGLNCAVVAIDPAGEVAHIKYISFSPELIENIVKITGLNPKNYSIPRQFWPGDRILTQHVPIWYPKPAEYFRALFPGLPRTVYLQSVKLLKFEEDDQVCILPLHNGNRPIGGLVIWGPNLRPTDSTILSIFGSQVAGILKNLANYESEVQRADELVRSNAMIIALSRVAAQLDTTTNLSQVYATLGKELKQIYMNCMVATLDHDKQNLKIDYFSSIEDINSLWNKLEDYLPKGLIIPRKMWPTEITVAEKVPYWDTDPIGNITKMFPLIPQPIFEKTFELAGIIPGYQICYLPMISEEDVIGILAVWGHNLSQEDVPGLSVFVNQVAYAIRNTRLYDQAQKEIFERTQAETRIREALKEKDVLLKEVHHRVKNNLQVISSLLNLQSIQIKDPETVQLFRDSQNRVRSMALIHEKLYQSHDLARIDFKGYAQSLSSYLMRSFAVEARGVTVRLDVDSIEMGIDQAIPCGLIINELVSNALKYAFPEERKGEVHIQFRRHGDRQFHLIVGDNGIGFPNHLDYQNTSSLGLQLVNSLASQLGGTIELSRIDGTEFHISFQETE